MNNRKSTDTFYKRFITMAESSKPSEDSRKNHSMASNQQNSFKKSDATEQSLSSSSFLRRSGIDAQTYVDVQSNGLTKRIVRYEEENKKTPIAYNRAYKRPGDFPIVHLNKSKLVLTPKRNSTHPPKIARIGGQPDPFINRTNIRAEILRNGTLMPPISVERREDGDTVRVDPLDALKEISRKRIHCNEDTVSQMPPIAALEKDLTDSMPSPPTGNQSKRQRIATALNSPTSNEASRKSNAKSNEIFSSLSSSSYMLSDSLKRAKSSSPSNPSPSPQAKRLQTEYSSEKPVIDAPSVNSVQVEKSVPVEKVIEKIAPSESTRPKLTLFNRPYSTDAPILPRANSDRKDECNIPFVKPRPMTARSRESVDNWLKIKPDEKRRLALMLKCLSGEVDDSDTVDSGDNVDENSVNPVIGEDKSTKPVGSDANAAEKSATATVTSTTTLIPSDNSSTTTTLIPSKPAITYSSIPSTTSISLPSTAATVPIAPPTATVTTAIVQPAITAEERKGGFAFPLATKSAAPTVVVSSASSTLSSSTSLPSATVTPLPVTSSTNMVPKESTSNPSVSFTFHVPKPKETSSSSAVTTSESTKTLTFGSASNVTNEQKKQTLIGTSEEPKKVTSFIPFGQASATSTATVSGFGSSMTSLNAFSKSPPSFGSIPTTTTAQQIATNDKPDQMKNAQTSIFGSALSTSVTKPVEPSNPPTVSALGSTPSFTFGASTNASAAFKTTQPTTTSSSFGSKSINSTGSIFGTVTPSQQQQQQGSTVKPIFESFANQNLFGQAPKENPIISTQPNVTESHKNVATQNIFGSSAPNLTSSAFTFSGSNQSNNIFGGQTSDSGTGNVFSFGGSKQKTDASSGSGSSAGKSFTFSGSKPVAFGAIAPAFGTSSVTDSAKSVELTANNQTNSTNLFNNKSTNEVPKVFSFGATTTTAASSFGASANPTNSATSSLGATPAFGSSSFTVPAFGNTTKTFGDASSGSIFGTKSVSASFGGISGSSATPSFASNNSVATFGNVNATPTLGTNTAPPVFGNVNSSSSFGSANANPVFGNSAPPAFGNGIPTFGSANAAPAFGTNTASPAFGNANTSTTFGSANVTPAFGNSAPSVFGTTKSLPSFGGTGSGETTKFFTASSNTTSFGSNLNESSSSSGFGGNSGTPAFTTSTGSADANRTFNFTGNDPAPSPVPNLFNIGPGNSSAPRGRTIRTATRRTYR